MISLVTVETKKLGKQYQIQLQSVFVNNCETTMADWDNPVTFITLTSGRMFLTSRRTFYDKHPAECLVPNLVLKIFDQHVVGGMWSVNLILANTKYQVIV